MLWELDLSSSIWQSAESGSRCTSELNSVRLDISAVAQTPFPLLFTDKILVPICSLELAWTAWKMDNSIPGLFYCKMFWNVAMGRCVNWGHVKWNEFHKPLSVHGIFAASIPAREACVSGALTSRQETRLEFWSGKLGNKKKYKASRLKLSLFVDDMLLHVINPEVYIKNIRMNK